MNAVSPDSILVVLPTYNEAETILTVITRIRKSAPGVHILVVDDSSPDQTGNIVNGYIERFDVAGEVILLTRAEKEGLGKAYLAGFDYAFKRGYSYIVSMDSDGSHQPEQLPGFISVIENENASLVLGSRWVAGGAVHNWPRRRKFLSKAGSRYAQMFLRTRIKDITGGYRVYQSDMLKSLLKRPVESRGYAFQVELAWRAEKAGYKVVETPILFIERTQGQSKMSKSIVFEAIWKIPFWAMTRNSR